jgi:cytochrome c553
MFKNSVLIVPFILFNVPVLAGSAATDAAADAAETALVEQEVNLAAAEKIFRKSCRACHGNKAQGAASYPKLSDKEPEYIAEKLEIYRSGEKIGPNSILMIQPAKKLSDEDIANISVYVATAFD